MIIVIISKAKIYFMCDLIALRMVLNETDSTEKGEDGSREEGTRMRFICGFRAFYTPNSPIYDVFCNFCRFLLASQNILTY